MKVVIFSGEIPSTVFIERLINELACLGIRIVVAGRIRKHISYQSSAVDLFGYTNKLSQLKLGLSLSLSLMFTAPAKFFKLINTLSRNNIRAFSSSWVNCLVIVSVKPDILHIQWAKTIQDWIWVKDFGIKLVASLRGAHINYTPIFEKDVANSYLRCFPKVDGFHAVSNAISAVAQTYGAPRERIRTIYSGLDIEKFKFRKSWVRESGNVRILSVGRAHWKKGYTYAIDAIKILKSKNCNCIYTVVGLDNEEAAFQVHDLGLTENVQLFGKLEFEKVLQLMESADIFLLPSVEEGIANVVLEAMAMGLPVISTNCGGMGECIVDRVNGFLIPTRDPASIVNAVLELLQLDCAALQAMAISARKMIDDRFAARRMGTEMKELYNFVLNSGTQ